MWIISKTLALRRLTFENSPIVPQQKVRHCVKEDGSVSSHSITGLVNKNTTLSSIKISGQPVKMFPAVMFIGLFHCKTKGDVWQCWKWLWIIIRSMLIMTFPTVFYSRLISLIMGKKSPYLNENRLCYQLTIGSD